jgi:hypothetical protein
MKKIIISLAALAAISTAALAERNYDLRDSAEAQGSFTVHGDSAVLNSDINALQSVDVASGTVLFGKYGIAKDAAELRRWDEKNGG